MKRSLSDSRETKLLEPRPYQVEMVNMARNESIIVKLSTGLGKSFIAAMVIKDHLPETYRPVTEGGKRIIFVAKTVHLVYQMAEFLRSQLPVSSNEIGIFHGQVAPSVWIDSWTKGIWQAQLEKHRVLVATAGVLRDVLHHRKLSLRDVCLIIFDECHHADPNSKSDYTDICQHLHAFPPGRWLPDYSRGPKVLGLSASLVNNLKRGESMETKVRLLEQLMRARVGTSTDSSIDAAMGRRHLEIKHGCGDTRLALNDPYYNFSQVLLRGVEKVKQLHSGVVREDYIDLESLLDENKKIKKEAFLSVMELHEFNSAKIKRILLQCVRVMEEFGVYCAAHACEQFERVLKGLLLLSSPKVITNPQCVNIIQTCLASMAEALETYRQIRQTLIAKLTQPLASNPTDPAWGEWIVAHFPMSSKAVSLLRLLLHYHRVVGKNNETLSALLLVKERIAAASVAHLITELSAMAPLYADLKASYCVSANPTNPVASLSTNEQLSVLDGFRTNAFNVLVATNVVEEGLDVRSCSVVIKADELTNFRSFIQSQGRARAKTSYFVLLTDDVSKCQANVDSFFRMSKMIDDFLECRCIDSMPDEEEEVGSAITDITRQSNLAYMPYGIDGPRITITSASSVLMRYTSLLKTDTSYPLQILYSVHKEFGGYRVQMLMPPPSPLQDIIKGPLASTRKLAVQLARLEACKLLHNAGLLGADLLPINFRQLVELSKHKASSTGTEQEQIEGLISRMSNLDLGNPSKDGETEPPSIMSQAHLLMMPMEEDINTDSAVSSDHLDVQLSSSDSDNVQNGDVDSGIGLGVDCEPLPPGIVYCGDPPMVEQSFTSTRTVDPVVDGGARLHLFDNYITDDELPVKKKKKPASRPLNIARFYPIHKLSSLSAPYQQPIEANRPVHLYTWQMPLPEHVAYLIKVDAAYFRHTDQTIGLLFSKPISKSDFVCRVPLYMQSGMMRVRLRRRATWNWLSAHTKSSPNSPWTSTSPSTSTSTSVITSFHFSRPPSLLSPPSLPPPVVSSCVSTVDPLNAQICGILLIVRLSGHGLRKASQALVRWAEERDFHVSQRQQKTAMPPPRNQSLLQSGICSHYGVQLSTIPTAQWSGLLVRPIDLPPEDPGSYAVLGPNSSGLCASSPVPDYMAQHLPEELRQRGATSYLDYAKFKHGTRLRLVQETRGLDPSTPLVTATRISRHRNAANVTSGVGVSGKEVIKEERIAQLCIVHPLNTWLWLTLCLTPTVLHQVYRSLSIGELANHLREILYSDNHAQSAHPPLPTPLDLPAGEFLMPDRHSVHPTCIPSIRKVLVQDRDGSSRFKGPVVCLSLDSETFLDRAVEDRCTSKAPAEVPYMVGLYEAFTSENAFEAANLERLEFLLLFATSPAHTDEGQLTYARIAHISNANLHRISMKFGLFRYFCSWSIADSMESLLGLCLLNLEAPRVGRLLNLFKLSNEPNPLSALVRAESVGREAYPSWVPLLLSPKHRVIDPTFAVEDDSLMAKRKAEVEPMLLASIPLLPKSSATGETAAAPEAVKSTPKEISEMMEERRLGLQPLEDIIGYRFRRIRILLQAITHPSSRLAFIWGCYQRLEFLGDAILDFVVTQRIYKDHPNMDPGELTDLRICLVSNINLAVVAVRSGIYKFLEYLDPNLWSFINSFSDAVSKGVCNVWKLEHDFNERNEMLSYKVLGDMFEAIIGAVFVDSGGVTSVVTGVIYHLLGREFEAYGKDLPMDPVRMMHELYPDLEISVVECLPANNSSGNSNSTTLSEMEGVNAGGQPCQRVRVSANYKGRRLSGEGFNLRTAKLKIAQQLGIGFT
ncbi:DiCer Related family member dcr 1 [Echinococcus multilocularis]|uniref:DiCer Related family member dcr 1 n=1 Tax=Echinococcus multilocularis TaxID=6211 RepID=A0A087W0D0_ECHMU|nr:DiCer Related family member dcr 1 [Echinococcus multilocularis]